MTNEKMYFGVVKTVEVTNSRSVVINLHEDGTMTLHVIATGFTKDIEAIIAAWDDAKSNGDLVNMILTGDNGNDYTLIVGFDGSIKIEKFEHLDISIYMLEELVKKIKEEETLHLDYCPHCGSSAEEQGVESHTSGFACNLCQKWIPFRFECTVIEEVKPSTPVRILWFSRHLMSEEYYKELERIYGAIAVDYSIVTRDDNTDIKWDIKNFDVLAVDETSTLLYEFVKYPGGHPVVFAKSGTVVEWELMEEYKFKTRRL